MYLHNYDDKFCLPSASLEKVFDFTDESNIKLKARDYSVELFKRFSDFQLGKYSIVRKELRWNKVTIEFKCNKKECAKKFRISCLKTSVRKGENLFFDVDSEEKDCTHTTPRNSNIAGSQRKLIADKLRMKSVNEVYRQMIADDDVEKAANGVTGEFSVEKECFE